MSYVSIEGTREQLEAMHELPGVQSVGRALTPSRRDRWLATARVSDSALPLLERLGCIVSVLATDDEPSGAARYRNVHDLLGELARIASTYGNVCQEQQRATTDDGHHAVQALRIGPASAAKNVLVTGGMHGDECAPPTALLSCCDALLAAHKDGHGLSYGALEISAADVKSIVETIVVWVIPLVNPDGYDRNQALGPWRKNTSGVAILGPDCVGVDVNRNFDILWQYETFYRKSAPLHISNNPCSDEYRGTAAFSEKESVAVRDLLLNESITYFFDCHSPGCHVIYPWTIDTNTTDPADQDMRFTNSAYDGRRDGVRRLFNKYKEFIDRSDLDEIEKVAGAMTAAVRRATGRRYRAAETADALYAAPGSGMDWAYSRHLISPPGPKIWAFAMECGSDRDGKAPKPRPYIKVEKEVHAAVLAFLRYVATGAVE